MYCTHTTYTHITENLDALNIHIRCKTVLDFNGE